MIVFYGHFINDCYLTCLHHAAKGPLNCRTHNLSKSNFTIIFIKSKLIIVKYLKVSESNSESGYSEVNGLKMYYEIYGQGKQLVLIHGGGSTI